MGKILKIVLFLIAFSGLVTVGGCATSFFMEPEAFGPAVSPDPQEYNEPIVQVYGADVWGVRGHFAIHTWIATKDVGDQSYTLYQVVGWQLRRKGTSLSVESTLAPNRYWFRSPPILLHEVKGTEAGPLIADIAQAVDDYPFAQEYVMWPGPNSNSFTQWVASRVPELGLELPAKAIGKGWMENYVEEASGE